MAMIKRVLASGPRSCHSSTACPQQSVRATTSTIRRPSVHLVRSSSDSSSSSSRSSSSSDSTGTGASVSVAVTNPPTATSAAAGGSSSRDAMLARIAQAKAYKQAAGSSSSSVPAGPSSSSSSSEALTAEQQEALRQQYIQQLQQQQQQLAAESSSYSSYLQNTMAPQENRSEQGLNSGPNALEQLEQEDPGTGPKRAPAREDFYSNNVPSVTDMLKSAPKRAGTGSADEAADFLKGVLESTADPRLAAMRAEEVTLAKEAAARQRGAEIITAFPEDFQTPDAAAAAAGSSGGSSAAAVGSSNDAAAQEQDEKYKPKVTTWGVFPRPSNISEAYGGGRNIRPGQALETPEQRAKREAEYAAALLMYKKATHTDSLSEDELATAQARYNSGMKLFKRGDIQGALVIFDEVREKVPLKSKLGGFSTLQAAVCYDTLGQGRKAEALYKRIRGHPTTEVSRKAKQLVFGFQAMSFLKTEGLSYAVKKEDYLKYFRRAADRNRYYVASDEEKAADQAEATRAAAMALGVVLGPVVILGALVATTKLG